MTDLVVLLSNQKTRGATNVKRLEVDLSTLPGTVGFFLVSENTYFGR